MMPILSTGDRRITVNSLVRMQPQGGVRRLRHDDFAVIDNRRGPYD